jgi:hypothetical protein
MKTGLKPLIAGLVLLAFGFIVVPLALIFSLLLADSDELSFLAPGTVKYSAQEPGHYYLWNTYQTVFEGKSYRRSVVLPDGVEICIRDVHGRVFDFISDTSISSRSGTQAKQSIGYIEVLEPTELSLSIFGEADARVFSFGLSKWLQMLALIFGGAAVSALIAIAGVIFLVIGIVKLASRA